MTSGSAGAPASPSPGSPSPASRGRGALAVLLGTGAAGTTAGPGRWALQGKPRLFVPSFLLPFVEYASLVTGYRALLIVIAACYGLAFLTGRAYLRGRTDLPAPAVAEPTASPAE